MVGGKWRLALCLSETNKQTGFTLQPNSLEHYVEKNLEV